MQVEKYRCYLLRGATDAAALDESSGLRCGRENFDPPRLNCPRGLTTVAGRREFSFSFIRVRCDFAGGSPAKVFRTAKAVPGGGPRRETGERLGRLNRQVATLPFPFESGQVKQVYGVLVGRLVFLFLFFY